MAYFEDLPVGTLRAEEILIGSSEAERALSRSVFYLKSATKTVVADGTATLAIPAGTLVLKAFVTVVTAAGEVCTATVGDGDTATGWIATSGTIDLNAAAGVRYQTVVADTYSEGKAYAAADTIDVAVTLNGGTGSVAFTIEALCVKL